MKQVIVARTDLGMGRGKIAAQVAHASLGAAEEAMRKRAEWYEEWKREGQVKVVVKAGGAAQLDELMKKSRAMQLPVMFVQDAGLTQLEPGTATCLGIGPAPAELVDRVTGKLRLL